MRLNPLRRKVAAKTGAGTSAADGAVTGSPDEEESRRVARRALLTGGAVVAGAVGTGAAMAATAAPARAATGDPVTVGETVKANTDANSTEIVAASNSNANPALVLTNTGSPGSGQASPPLRVTPATGDLTNPAAGAAGDITHTVEGNLWFVHNNPSRGPILARVHTDATANSFMPLYAPYRILDTRTSAGREHIINASGNLNSSGMVLAGHTIHIDLSTLVDYADAVTANLTVIDPAHNGWVLIWPGSGSRPNASSIAFSKGQAIANLTVCGVNHQYSNSNQNTVAVTSAETTHVILDVAGFYVPDFLDVKGAYLAFEPMTRLPTRP